MNCFRFVDLEDILIFSLSPQEHTVNVLLVLQRLLENKLFIKAENVSSMFPLSASWGT